jgi:hypothetical protein
LIRQPKYHYARRTRPCGRENLTEIEIEGEDNLMPSESVGKHLAIGCPVHPESSDVFSFVVEGLKKGEV